jgi:hypothetical protein
LGTSSIPYFQDYHQRSYEYNTQNKLKAVKLLKQSFRVHREKVFTKKQFFSHIKKGSADSRTGVAITSINEASLGKKRKSDFAITSEEKAAKKLRTDSRATICSKTVLTPTSQPLSKLL